MLLDVIVMPGLRVLSGETSNPRRRSGARRTNSFSTEESRLNRPGRGHTIQTPAEVELPRLPSVIAVHTVLAVAVLHAVIGAQGAAARPFVTQVEYNRWRQELSNWGR